MKNVIEYDFHQRAFDGKWERLAKIVDTSKRYSFKDQDGRHVSLVPTKWITVGVYDLLGEANGY